MGKGWVITSLVERRIFIWIQCEMSKDRVITSLVMRYITARV
jgi:hypothetical protein